MQRSDYGDAMQWCEYGGLMAKWDEAESRLAVAVDLWAKGMRSHQASDERWMVEGTKMDGNQEKRMGPKGAAKEDALIWLPMQGMWNGDYRIGWQMRWYCWFPNHYLPLLEIMSEIGTEGLAGVFW